MLSLEVAELFNKEVITVQVFGREILKNDPDPAPDGKDGQKNKGLHLGVVVATPKSGPRYLIHNDKKDVTIIDALMMSPRWKAYSNIYEVKRPDQPDTTLGKVFEMGKQGKKNGMVNSKIVASTCYHVVRRIMDEFSGTIWELSVDAPTLKIQEGILSIPYSEIKRGPKLGEGGFGDVFSGEWRRSGCKVALKQVKEDDGINGDKVFLNEVRLLKQLNSSERIINFIGVTQDHEKKYLLVLQFANGGTLREYLKNAREQGLEPKKDVRMQIVRDIVDGLVFIHDKGIVHRDLHSNNVLRHDGRWLITDFGISRKLDSKTSKSIEGGVYAYLDPAFLSSQNYRREKPSDIYSLGVLMWEVWCVRTPFQELEGPQIIAKVLGGGREVPEPGTPRQYVELYQHCWDQDSDKRPTIGEVRNRLENLQLNEPYIGEFTPVPQNLYASNDLYHHSDRSILDPQSLLESSAIIKKLPPNQTEESIGNGLENFPEPQKLQAPNNIYQHSDNNKFSASTQAKISVGQFSASNQNSFLTDGEECVKLTKDEEESSYNMMVVSG